MPKSLLFDIEEVRKLFCANKNFNLRGLSNRLIREASIENNYGKAELGIISYALHKLSSKEHIVNNPKWVKAKNSIATYLVSALTSAKKNDHLAFLKNLKDIVTGIEKIDSELGHYAQNIYEKAKVKQASLAYSYGLSISQAAELTGASKKDLQSYIGVTTVHDNVTEPKGIKERVNELKIMLGVNSS